MKKIFLTLLIFTLVGCQMNTSSKKDAIIKLEGNPTTGYEWSCASETNILNIISSYETKGNDNITGAPGEYIFTLEGKKSGHTTLTCTYKRSWEETAVDITKVYEIDVASDLEVTIKE